MTSLLFPESSLHECQNKRKHDVVSKRPKYVESDSDEAEAEAQNQTSSEDECEFAFSAFRLPTGTENVLKLIPPPPFLRLSLTDVRKRHKKDHDKKLKHEERRSSGEHRKSGGQQAARRTSSGRRRDWNSDESSDGSPPPSLNDGTVFSCCVSPVDHTFVLITCIIM